MNRMKRMKPIVVALTLALAVLLSGCALLEQVNSTVDYATEATAFLNEANGFAERLPALAEQAIADPNALASLRTELEAMTADIAAFNALEAPAIAEELHRQIVAYNEDIAAQLDGYVQQIDQNVIDLDALANAPVLETIRSMTALLNQLEQLQQ